MSARRQDRSSRYRLASGVEMILIPGLWLDASSWEAVVPVLEKAGHRARPLTLPGMESRNADRSGVTLRDHVDAVVAAIDAADGDVVLVGHSGGGAIAHAAVDARPDRVLRVVHVDSWPIGTGGCINDQLPSENGEVPLPDWSSFDDEDLVDLDEQLRAAFRARAIPSPLQVAAGRQELSDERRYEVPVTVIACEFSSARLREWMAQGVPQLAELAAVRDVRFIDLPTGHWPQFTRPGDLGEAIVHAATATRARGDSSA
jgi:pimeloyl-ACP methyl ester carboxylesterase